MKKTMTTLAAAMIAATSLGAFSAFASEANAISLSTATLEAAITTDNGTVIPVGATAVTVSISNNTGFISKSVVFDAGSADVIVDEAGVPVVDCGSVLKDSVIGASENDGVMMIAAASAEVNGGDGDVFTFYVNSNAEDVSVTAIDPVYSANTASPMAIRDFYIVGDVTNDGVIDPQDASYILSAVSASEEKDFTDILPVATANADLAKYFGTHIPKHAGAADSNQDGFISRIDAQMALNYYSCLGTSSEPTFKETGYCGEVRYFNK